MATWAAENQKQKTKLAAAMLGTWYAQAAVVQCASQDQGKGFSVGPGHVAQAGLDLSQSTFQSLFLCVEPSMLVESESLQGLAKAFGYSVTASRQGYNPNWQVDFKRAF